MHLPYLTLGCLSFAFAVMLTPAAGWLARPLGCVDQPNARKIHRQPIPLLGGLAIYLAIVLALFAGVALDRRSSIILIGGGVAMALGLVDDRLDLPSRYRLGVHLLIAFTLASLGVRAPLTGQDSLDITLSALWIVGAMNAWNCLDCADGTAGGSAVVGCLALGLIAAACGREVVASVAFIAAGATLGFLVFNFPPARIFLGDTGSTLLGLLLGSLSLLAVLPDPAAFAGRIPWGVLALAVPVYDFILVHVRRYVAGVRNLRDLLSSTGKDHLPHRLLARGLSARSTALVTYVFVALPALAATCFAQAQPLLGGMALASTAALLWHLDENTRVYLRADHVAIYEPEPATAGLGARLAHEESLV